MGNNLLFSSSLCPCFFFFFFFTILSIHPVSAASSCPVDLSYVQTVPWDTSLCRQPDGLEHCCQTLLSVLGMGLAQHLRETSMFQFPNSNASSACLSDFQAQLATLSIDPSLVPSCFKNSSQFVSSNSSCVGIVTTQDWIAKVGPMTPLNTACRGDFSELTRCSSCLDAGQKINSQLTSLDPNATSKCFYYTCLYAAGIVSELGPLDAKTAACTLALPLVNEKPAKSKDKLLKLVFGLLGSLIGVLLAFGLITMYRKWDRKRKVSASHERFVSSFKASMLPNSGAKWFHLSELERATQGFSQRNFIGQGAYGVVYKGTLADGTLVAVKQMHDLDSQGDEDFSNEVEIISKIRHRNLLSLRGCCVTSDNSKGKRRYLVYDFMSNGSLDWAWTLAKSGKFQEILDESIRDQGPKGVMERFVLVGILCAHVMVAFRPTIADALRMLEGDIDIPRLPGRPLPLGHESFRHLCKESSYTTERSRTSSSSRE
uniref:non-specific serine/threonine protein kinase n=1 Tax=Populus alba TaxID=43335 RepID=A0A4U5PU69_POPAL|nr:putative receptor-like protein kinase [Populus alba]